MMQKPAVPARGIAIGYSPVDGAGLAQSLRERIGDAAPALNAEALLVVLTPDAVRSGSAKRQWLHARRRGAAVVPVLFEAGPRPGPDALPAWMRRSGGFTLPDDWDQLLAALRSGQRERIPFQSPPLPEKFIQREEEYSALLDKVLNSGPRMPSIAAALVGGGGYGKTTLASALCHDDALLDAFADGILWVTVGENPDTRAVIASLYEALAGHRQAFPSVRDAASALAALLAVKTCLLVFDDVRQRHHLKPLLRATGPSACLITTRRADLAVESTRVSVQGMTTPEAAQMLAAVLDPPPHSLEPFQELAHGLGEWPLLIELTRSALKARIRRGEKVADALGALQQLTAGSLNPSDAVSRAVAASLELLPEQDRPRCRELAVFSGDTAVPVSEVVALWGASANDSYTRLQLLEQLSLLHLESESGTIRLHPVIRGALEEGLADPAAAHGRLIDAWGDLKRLPSEYSWRSVGYHLVEAGRPHVLRRLLFDFDWLMAKLNAAGVRSLLHEFDRLTGDEVVEIAAGSVRLAASALALDTKLLPSQICGRLLTRQEPEILALRTQAARGRQFPWLQPLWPALEEAGGALRLELPHDAFVHAVALSPDGSTLVSGSEDNTVKVWNIESGTLLRSLEGHDSSVLTVAVSEDGRTVVSGSEDKTLRVWDLETGAPRMTLAGHASSVDAVAISPDGRTAISGSDDETVKVWSLEDGKLLLTLSGHTGSVNAVAFSAGGREVISGSSDETIKVWDRESGVLRHTLQGHTGSVNAIAVCSDGRTLVSGSNDHTLAVWDLETAELRKTLSGYSSFVTAAGVTADGRMAVSGSYDDTVKVWDLESGALRRTLAAHTDVVTAVAVSADGRTLVSGSYDDTVKVWSLHSAVARRAPSGHISWVTAVAIAADGKTAVSGSWDSTLKVWDLETGELRRTLSGQAEEVNAVAVTPDARTVIAGSWDHTLKLWDLETGALRHTLARHTHWVNAVAVSPDGRTALSGSRDSTVKVWDLESASLRWTLIGHTDRVTAVAIGPDSLLGASASDDKTINLWDLETGEMLFTLKGHTTWVTSVAFSPDGRRLVSGSWDNKIIVWDIETGEVRRTLTGHTGWITALAFGSDNHKLVSTSYDQTVRVWDEAGNLVALFQADAAVLCCAVTAAGLILAGDEAGNLHLLELM
jgi:WD40 repeat protein